jgi:heterodisulfide reductase subunit A-like polyferredoxin
VNAVRLEQKADLIIIGGVIGRCTAALEVAKNGTKVVLTEETDWIGGKLTSQAVPPDEHQWIEQFDVQKRIGNLETV